MLKKITLLSTLLVVLGLLLFSPAQVSSATNDFEVVRATVDQWLSSQPKVAMSADAVYEILNDGNPDNDPFILSVRNPSHYALGHIPGAVNSPLRSVANANSLMQLPTTQPILAYGYDAPDGQTAMTALNLMGYHTNNLKWGMMAWSANDQVLAYRRLSPSTIPDYPIETKVNEATTTYPFPTLNTGANEQTEIVRRAVDNYLSSGKALTISREAFVAMLNDGDPSNDPFILSVRPPAAYNAGHIPGAINIPLFSLGKAENLAKLPSERPIVAYCHSSHMAGIATTILNVLGYDVINLEGGISTWNTNTELVSAKPFSSAQQRDYPVEGSAVSPAPDVQEEAVDMSKVRGILNQMLR